MSDLEQERRVSGGRAVREARLDGGDDAARHAVAVAVGLAAPGAPRLVAGRLEPREALVPLVGPALGAPVPRLRLVALRGGVGVGVVGAAVARRPAPERRERLRKRACVAWTFVSLHAIEPTRSRGQQTQLRKHVASMAWGARNLISTQDRAGRRGPCPRDVDAP